MDIKDTRVLMRRIADDANLLRTIVEKETSDARMLLDPEIHREFSDVLLSIGNDIELTESKWRYFGLMGYGNKTMRVWKKYENANGESD